MPMQIAKYAVMTICFLLMLLLTFAVFNEPSILNVSKAFTALYVSVVLINHFRKKMRRGPDKVVQKNANFTSKNVKLLTVCLVLVSIPLLYISFQIGVLAVQEYQSEKLNERDGIYSDGTVIGFTEKIYTYKSSSKDSGFYPVISYNTSKGEMQIVGSPGHPLTKDDQSQMLGRKFTVRYLSNIPERGVVLAWHKSDVLKLTGLSLCLMLTSVILFYVVWSAWRKVQLAKAKL